MAKFLAWYEDAAKVEAGAKKRGFTGRDGESWHDFVEADLGKYSTKRAFPSLGLAIAWLTARCKSVDTVYGSGTIRKIEPCLSA